MGGFDDRTASLGAGGSSKEPVRQTFDAGELVAGRYRVVRFLARGGMGEVYWAEDLELGEPVALKTVQPQAAADSVALERFRREIQLARRVTHPNVCRLFEFGQHSTGAGEKILFLTMELLDGETLAERLQRAGRLDEATALPIVRQLCAALDAAHQAGVVHRDFKSANVMLVPRNEEKGTRNEERPASELVPHSSPLVPAERVVVTDFGLAYSSALEDRAAAGADSTQLLLGTPAYMAPEQIEGGALGPATDLYALGVVLYEMITGTLPFSGDAALPVLLQRLHRPPAPPREHVPELGERWQAAILRCLQRDPRERFASASAVLAALDPSPAASRQREPRPSVAVLGFKSLSGRPAVAWLSTALAETLGSELALGERLRIIAGENVARARLELGLAEAESFAPDTLERLRRNLGADLVVLGSYLTLGASADLPLRLDVRLQETASGETLAVLRDVGTVSELSDLLLRIGAQLRERLGVEAPPGAQAHRPQGRLPANPYAARLHAEGLARLQLLDALGARDLLEQAVAADPRHPLAHAALSAAWSALGYEARARDAARRAHELAAWLPREERLLVEGRYRETAGDWDEAIEVYRTLFKAFPDQLDHGLRLAEAQLAAGRVAHACDTLAALRATPPPVRDDPRLDLLEARLAYRLSDPRAQLEAATCAADKAALRGARLLLAEAKLTSCMALQRLGEPARALAACEEAQRLFAVSGDRGGVARSLRTLAALSEPLGRPAEQVRAMYDEALSVFREIGDRKSLAGTLWRLANFLQGQDELAAAREGFEEALGISREIDYRFGIAWALGGLGSVLAVQGELARARGHLEEVLTISREHGFLRGISLSLGSLAATLAWGEDLPRARQLYEEAVALHDESEDRLSAARMLLELAGVLLAQDELALARHKLEEAWQRAETLHSRRLQSAVRLKLAELALEQGEPAEAEALARQAVAQAGARHERRGAARAAALLAGSLLAQGRIEEAVEAAKSAREPLDAVGPELQGLAAIAAARVQAASGAAAAALEQLERLLAGLEASELLRLRLEAALALGEIELDAGRPEAGRARLEQVAAQARAHGLHLLARKAARAVQTPR